MRNYLGEKFVWFIGVVEDRNDPLQLGRVRVRCAGIHTDDKDQIPTNSLPWAIPLNGIDSASNQGVGQSPTGMQVGTWVIGFFMDGNRAQEPAVIGTTYGIPDESDVNALARGTNTKTHTPDSTIGEPDAPYAGQYPYVRVMETESGHVKEYDDTPDHERIRELHKSGTFYEIHPNGDHVTHVVRKRYSVIASDDAVHVKGDVNIVVDGSTTINCSNVRITGDLSVGGDVTTDAGVSLNSHTHTDTAGLGAGTTSSPNK